MTQRIEKSESLRVRLSTPEKTAFIEFCEKIDVKYSVVLRRMIRSLVSHGPSFFDPEQQALKDLRNEVRNVGRNINQIAKRINLAVNAGESLSAAEVEKMHETLSALTVTHREIQKVIKTILDNSNSRRVRLRKIAAADD